MRGSDRRRKAERARARQRDLYAMLSQTNQAIVRMGSRDQLFPAVCRIAVEHGHFLFAWIGLIDKDDNNVKPVAKHGEDGGYVERVRILADASDEAGRGPTGQALRSGLHVITNDFLGDPATAPWREAARRAGVRAKSAFPLRLQGEVVGTLNLYAGEPGYFTGDLLPTLDSMAEDVSFALGNFARAAERSQAVEALRRSEARFRSLFESMLNGYAYCRMQYDERGRPVDFVYLEVNDAFERLTGLKEVVGRRVTDVIPGIRELNPELFQIYGRVASGGGPETFDIDFKPLAKWLTICVYSQEKGYFIAIFDDITERKRADEQIQRYVAQLETAFMSTVEVATTLSEMRDPYTVGHERRVAQIAVAIGTELGFEAHRLEGMRVAGYLHDVGKITVPAEILSKPGGLSPIEFSLIQGHAQASYEVLKDVKFPWPVAEVALQHHERMDGSGYPRGLSGEAILLEARILAVADVVEAMSSHRPYRPALGIDKALAEIERGRGTLYDASVADACLKLFREGRYRLPA